MLSHLKILIVGALVFLGGCRTYTENTPREYFEGDNAANYQRIFHEAVPADVTVVNSVVVGYSWRLGVVTTDDFEIELIAPPSWINGWKKDLFPSTLGIAARKARPIRPWYAPKPLDAYRSYRDRTSVGYIHLLEETRQAKGVRPSIVVFDPCLRWVGLCERCDFVCLGRIGP